MRREHRGRQRNNNAKTFPYEPLVMGGRLVMPAELQRVHRAALGGAQITDDMRAVVEKRWPELILNCPARDKRPMLAGGLEWVWALKTSRRVGPSLDEPYAPD
jgi:hypothetical protein